MLKVAFDRIGALALIVLFSPLLIAVAVAVRLKLGSPILFRQVRLGQAGRTFTLVKFRTMLDERDAEGRPLSDEARLTKFGAWLRSSSLDELPELFNVLWGEMSLVGPRPLLVEYREEYTEQQFRRHDVLPGITGWAQINGRNLLSWDEKFDLDVWYVDHRNLWLDIRILFSTIMIVLTRRGVAADGHVTMPPFRRSENSAAAGKNYAESNGLTGTTR